MKTEWDLGELKTDFAKERFDTAKAYDDFREKWEKDTSYLKDPKKLKEALEDLENLEDNFSLGGNEGYYYFLKEAIDQNNTQVRASLISIEEFTKKQRQKVIFFAIKLSKIDKDREEKFLAEPSLGKYEPYLRNLFENAQYLLSENEEKILSLKGNASYDLWVKMVSSLLAKEKRESWDEDKKKEEFVYPELMTLMQSSDRKVRTEAKKAFEDIIEKYEDIAEFELNAVLEDAKIDDELRGYKRPDESRIKGDLIDLEFVDSILAAVKEKFSISREYYALKARLMGQEKIGYFERATELKKIEKKFDVEESVNIVKEVFSGLDGEFLSIFNNMINEGKVDFLPKAGKMGGGFCTHSRRDQPIYIMLNHTDKIKDVTTLAHEMGHAINHTLMKKQGPLYNQIPKSTAEVASTFMEDFVYPVISKMLREEDSFYLKISKFEGDIADIQRQIALYLFELEIHDTYRKEGYLSKDKIGKIFSKHMSEYLGDSVEIDEKTRLWWIYWEHIRYYFYVYSYASGLLIAKAMQKNLNENPKFIEKVKIFLSTGTSKKPREIFRDMGIEVNKEFFMEGLSEMEKDFEEIKALAKKLGKI